MKHIIVSIIIIAIVAIYMVYKCFEVFVNTVIPAYTEERLYYQLDMYGTKRLLLSKIPI